MKRDGCATIQPYLLLFSNHPTGLVLSPPLSFLAIKIYGQEGAQLCLSTINLSWLLKTDELLSPLVSSQEDGRKWEESRG